MELLSYKTSSLHHTWLESFYRFPMRLLSVCSVKVRGVYVNVVGLGLCRLGDAKFSASHIARVCSYRLCTHTDHTARICGRQLHMGLANKNHSRIPIPS